MTLELSKSSNAGIGVQAALPSDELPGLCHSTWRWSRTRNAAALGERKTLHGVGLTQAKGIQPPGQNQWLTPPSRGTSSLPDRSSSSTSDETQLALSSRR